MLLSRNRVIALIRPPCQPPGAALILPSRTRARAARLATRNTKDFTDTGIGIIDPWEHSGSA